MGTSVLGSIILTCLPARSIAAFARLQFRALYRAFDKMCLYFFDQIAQSLASSWYGLLELACASGKKPAEECTLLLITRGAKSRNSLQTTQIIVAIRANIWQSISHSAEIRDLFLCGRSS
jgi:hypothetical protein